ncbi:CoA ester lyase [Bradyrhizobium tropiciagri]|uniref:HpcH/HpaI aldolase/citrate lyase family protein n=1 Tax=Bradyrhizobium tropiciagri TaxID=312253 RepID=UPI001BAABA40|nr:CoA ester lyase [Bradyrhizobium tropiciagri]MBR0870672.1 CoA ester lyase [Bradyrhizobium tropiciagri]
MRSLLFVPGNSEKMISKAAASGADVIILDLEDAVRPDAKPEARRTVVATLAGESAGPRRFVRVNSLDTAWCREDVEAVIPAAPDGIVLPKSAGPEDIVRLSDLIDRHEPQARKGKTAIIVVCTETPSSTLSLAAKSWRHPRLAGLMWGGEDLSAAIGATANRDQQGHYTAPFTLARNLCLLAARAADVAPIDAVFTDFRDDDGLRRESNSARRDGFSAKAAIHPSQVEIINRCFTPTDEERRWAERVIAAFESAGKGAVQLDGVMLDAPHLKQARLIMAGTSAK